MFKTYIAFKDRRCDFTEMFEYGPKNEESMHVQGMCVLVFGFNTEPINCFGGQNEEI